MALKLGSGDVALRVGANAATKAYLGATQVWPTASPVTVYSQTFGTGIDSWAVNANASAPTRNTARYADGALYWSAVAAGESTQARDGIAVTPGKLVTLTAQISHSATAARDCYFGAITHTADWATQTDLWGPWTSVPTGTTASTLTHTLTVPAGQPVLWIAVGLVASAVGEQLWVDGVTVTQPA